MGDKGGGGSNVGRETERMARDYYDATDPLRSTLINNYMGFLGGPTTAGPAASPSPVPPASAPDQTQEYADLTAELARLNYLNDNMSEKMRDNHGLHDTSRIEQQIRDIELSRMGLPVAPTTDPRYPFQPPTPRDTHYEPSAPAPPAVTPAADGGTGGLAYDVTRNPVYRAGRQTLEDQYDVGRQNILAQTPAGGALIDSLAQMEQGRSQSLGGLSAQVAQDEYNKLYGMATGAPGQAMSTMSNLAGQQAMANAQEQAGKAGAMGDLGLGAGMLLAK